MRPTLTVENSRSRSKPVGPLVLLAALAVMGLAGCGESQDRREDRAEDAAADAEAGEQAALSSQSYEQENGSGDCTSDCSGHDAGWQYAKEHELSDASQCTGDSDSFVAGCKSYIESVEAAGDEAAEDVRAGRKPDN